MYATDSILLWSLLFFHKSQLHSFMLKRGPSYASAVRSDVVEVLLLGNGGALVEGWLDGNIIENDKMITNLDDRQSSHGLLSFSLLGRIECRKRAGRSRN